jgi:hypothetical protein
MKNEKEYYFFFIPLHNQYSNKADIMFIGKIKTGIS